MRRIILTLLLGLASALPAMGAGVFNGTTSDLVLTGVSTPDYPILVSCWFKASNATSNGTLIGLSNNGSGGLQSLLLAARGDVVSDPLYAQATASGASSEAVTTNGFTAASTWYLAVGLFESNASRTAVLSSTLTHNPVWSAEQTTTRAITNLTHTSIGSLWNGGAGTRFTGKIAEPAVWSAVDLDLVDVAVRQLASGIQPNHGWSIIRDSLFLYQPLIRDENEGSFVGDPMTETGLTFDDDAPHPGSFPGGPSYLWPVAEPSPGPLPYARIVKLVGGYLALADGDDTNAIGVIGLPIYYGDYASGRQRVFGHLEQVLRIEVAAGVTFDHGEPCFQAADGKISDTGTIRVGVTDQAGTAGEVIRALPSWTQ